MSKQLQSYLAFGLIAALTGISTAHVATRSAQDAAAKQSQGPASLSLVRTLSVPSAVPLADPDAVPPKHGLDTYVDWDLGTTMTFHDAGAMTSERLVPNWIFRFAADDKQGLYAMVVQRVSGASFFMDNGAWSPIDEPEGETALVGDYGLHFEAKNGEAYGIRFDSFTGRSWLLDGSRWFPLPGNLVDWPAKKGDGK